MKSIAMAAASIAILYALGGLPVITRAALIVEAFAWPK